MMAKILSLALGLTLAISATAADAGSTTANASAGSVTARKALKRYPYHANVAAVDPSAKTITLDGKKKQRILYITPATRILKDKKPVALETVKVGDYITGSVVDTNGRLEPTTVNVGGTNTGKLAQRTSPTGAGQATAAPQTGTITTVKSNPSSQKKGQ